MVGGAEQSTLLLAQELSQRGHHVDVVSTTGRADVGTPELQSRRFEGISGKLFEATPGGSVPLALGGSEQPASLLTRAIHHGSLLRVTRWGRHIEAICRDQGPDILHTNTIVGQSGLVWGAAKRAGVPVLHTLRDYQLLCSRTTLLRSSGKECVDAPVPCQLLRRFQRPLSRNVDLVTAPSRFVLDRHLGEGYFADARAEVVPNAAGSPIEPCPERSGKSLTLIYLGQLDEHKGVGLLMSVLGPVFESGEFPGLTVGFAGDGPLRARVDAFAARYPDRATSWGFVGDKKKASLLEEADALVLPSIWNDNFPRVMLDAFRWGLPVLGARRGGIPEVVKNGKTGLLFEPDEHSLQSILRKVCDNPSLLPPLGRAAHAESSRYGVDVQVERFLELYEELIAGGARPIGP